MGVAEMIVNGPVSKGLAELNKHLRDEQKEIRGGVMGEGQGLSEEDESRINEDAEDVNDGWLEAVQVQVHDKDVLQRPQQQPQGPLVCWERFLPLRSLKVLLVESDDATRRVICALLRNCGYKVIAVENGLQAWKILEDLTDQIDLVLTEAIMPCLSGIGLLRKIMSHKICKNIPVIMMSSHDSMSIVFKCLSKGAVYFLVKPIRKNELQNLWQHVWRKCPSSSGSGSGSESGIMTQKSTKSKSAEESDNNSGSNDEDDIGSIGLNMDGSDNGSGTQSSWTMRAAEVERPKPTSPWDQLADPPESNHSRPEAFGNSWVPMRVTKEGEEQGDEPENALMGKDLEIGVPRIPNLQLEDPTEKAMDIIADIDKEKPDINSKKDDEQLEKTQPDLTSDELNNDVKNQASDLMGVITDSDDSPIKSTVFHNGNGLFKDSGKKEKAVCDSNELPSLELSLKRPRDDDGDTRTSLHEQNVLRHSDQHSAFSRYNSASTANRPPTRNVNSSSPLGHSSKAAKTESVQNPQSNTNDTPPSQCPNGSSNNSDMGLITKSAFTKPMVFSDKPTPKSTVKCLHPSTFQPAQNGHISLPQPAVQGKAETAMSSTILGQMRGMSQQVQVQHHHHHYHHHHHHLHNMPQQQLANQDDLSLKNMAAASAQCSSSNMLGVGNTSNNNLNGSTSGSNGQNGSCGGSNIESDNGLVMQGGAGDGIGYGSWSGVDKNRLDLREAALNKFRQKRKERCFEKKVRYHSRKKLAEQRPRVRGQFVRQVVHENK